MPFQKYLIALISFSGLLFGVLLLNVLMLYRAGELKDHSEMISEQVSENKFVNTTVTSILPYKIAMYARIKPDIVLMGTSTAQQFRQSMFKASFYNLGGTGWGPYESAYVLEKILKIHKPKIILFGQDMFALCDSQNEIGKTVEIPTRVTGGHALNRGYDNPFFPPFDLALKGHLSPAEYVDIVFTEFPDSGHQSHFLGVFGKLFLAGFAKDGSFVRIASELATTRPETGKEEQLVGRGGHFNVCESSAFRLEMLEFLISRIRDMGVDLVGFVPPYAPKAYRQSLTDLKLKVQRQMYQSRLKNMGFDEFYDFYDPRSLGAKDCEFTDNVHLGDIVAVRMLKSMTDKGSARMATWIDIGVLESMLSELRGTNLVLRDDYMMPFREALRKAHRQSPACAS